MAYALLPGVGFAPAARRARLMARCEVDLVMPYDALAGAAAGDARWETWRLALGARRAVAGVHVAEDSRNSSLLAVGPRHLRAVPDSRTVARETAEMERLDDVWPRVVGDARRPYLKIDTQGYERHGFSPIAFEGVLDDPDTGEMLQADAIFRVARP